MFTKSDLQNGDFLVQEDGTVEMCVLNLGVLLCDGGGSNQLSSFNDDLTYYADSKCDIVKVYRPTTPYQCCFDNYEQGLLIYERVKFDINIWERQMVNCAYAQGYHFISTKQSRMVITYNLQKEKAGVAIATEYNEEAKNLAHALAYCNAEQIELPKEVINYGKNSR